MPEYREIPPTVEAYQLNAGWLGDVNLPQWVKNIYNSGDLMQVSPLAGCIAKMIVDGEVVCIRAGDYIALKSDCFRARHLSKEAFEAKYELRSHLIFGDVIPVGFFKDIARAH